MVDVDPIESKIMAVYKPTAPAPMTQLGESDVAPGLLRTGFTSESLIQKTFVSFPARWEQVKTPVHVDVGDSCVV